MGPKEEGDTERRTLFKQDGIHEPHIFSLRVNEGDWNSYNAGVFSDGDEAKLYCHSNSDNTGWRGIDHGPKDAGVVIVENVFGYTQEGNPTTKFTKESKLWVTKNAAEATTLKAKISDTREFVDARFMVKFL